MPGSAWSARRCTLYLCRLACAAVASEVVVLRVGELSPGTSKKFLLDVDGREEECFVVNFEGQLHAWVNRCMHVPMSMDWVDNQFFTEDKRYVMCATHGAWYEPDSGECVSGPPCGKVLIRVPLEQHGNEVIARSPEGKP